MLLLTVSSVSAEQQTLGTFKFGKPDVEGIYYANNENIQYQGQHINGKYNGHGILYRDNGTIIWEGEWRNGRKHGRGRLYGDDGLLIAECIYDNDNYDRAI
jgi:antitoxin component YwqK of YwqJK toxin-antitoxin module